MRMKNIFPGRLNRAYFEEQGRVPGTASGETEDRGRVLQMLMPQSGRKASKIRVLSGYEEEYQERKSMRILPPPPYGKEVIQPLRVEKGSVDRNWFHIPSEMRAPYLLEMIPSLLVTTPGLSWTVPRSGSYNNSHRIVRRSFRFIADLPPGIEMVSMVRSLSVENVSRQIACPPSIPIRDLFLVLRVTSALVK